MICNHEFKKHAILIDGTSVFVCSKCSQKCSSEPSSVYHRGSPIPQCSEVGNESAGSARSASSLVVIREPVGTKLSEILGECGIGTPNCGDCKRWIAKMNEWGINKCEENRASIISRLNSESKKASWISWAKVAAKGYTSSAALLNEAIKRAST